jgi:hypothetical protein
MCKNGFVSIGYLSEKSQVCFSKYSRNHIREPMRHNAENLRFVALIFVILKSLTRK